MQTAETSAQPDTDVDVDTVQASIFYLMTHYSQHSDVRVARAVVDQINYLLNHSLIELLPVQRETLAKLLNIWRAEGTLAACSEHRGEHSSSIRPASARSKH